MQEQDNRQKRETVESERILPDEDGLPLNEQEDEVWKYFDAGEDEYEDCDRASKRRTVFLRIIALITALSFLGLTVVTAVPFFRVRLADLISQSLQLEKDIDIQRLKAAVVKIDVMAKKSLGVEQKSGTGFNIDPGGVIVTNHHVIEDAQNMIIRFQDGSIYKPDYWSASPDLDLAVISLDGKGLPSVPLDTSNLPVPGDRVRVAGNPLGLNSIVVEGKVKEYLRVNNKPERIFSIDAPIYPGNSGSPVFNSEGCVVGVVFASWHREENGEKNVLGLAIPVKEITGLKNRF